MSGYKVVAVFWEDHLTSIGTELPENPDEVFDTPTLTVGVLLCETEKSLLIAHDIERLNDTDNGTYSVILKNCVVAIKEFGNLQIDNIRWKGA